MFMYQRLFIQRYFVDDVDVFFFGCFLACGILEVVLVLCCGHDGLGWWPDPDGIGIVRVWA